jgi:hypothetical protein
MYEILLTLLVPVFFEENYAMEGAKTDKVDRESSHHTDRDQPVKVEVPLLKDIATTMFLMVKYGSTTLRVAVCGHVGHNLLICNTIKSSTLMFTFAIICPNNGL